MVSLEWQMGRSSKLLPTEIFLKHPSEGLLRTKIFWFFLVLLKDVLERQASTLEMNPMPMSLQTLKPGSKPVMILQFVAWLRLSAQTGSSCSKPD